MHRKSLSTTGSVLVTRRPPCPWMDARYGWWMPSGKPIWGCYFKTGSWHIEKKMKKRPSVPSNTMNLYTLLISCVYIYIHIFGMILSFNCWLLYPNFLRDLVGGQPELQEFSQQEYLQEVHQKCNEPRWVHNKNRTVFLVGTTYWITDLRNLWKTIRKSSIVYCGWVRRPINIAPHWEKSSILEVSTASQKRMQCSVA